MGLFSALFGGGNKKSERIAEALANGSKVIDVRTPAEFKQGKYPGSVNIPLNTFENKIKSLQKEKQPIILCCRSGNRAEAARGMLSKHGIESINAGAWQAVVKAKK